MDEQPLLFEGTSSEEVLEYRKNYQKYRMGASRGAKGELNAEAMRRRRREAEEKEQTRLQRNEQAVKTFNAWTAVKVASFNAGAALYIAGSVMFIQPLLKDYPGVGGWLFVVGSVFYTLGAGIDLRTVLLIQRGFASALKTGVKRVQRREVLLRLVSLGAFANTPLQIHQNAGTLPSEMPLSGDALDRLTPHFGVASSRKERFKQIEMAVIAGVQEEAKKMQLAAFTAATYLVSCSVGFIGGSLFFVPFVYESMINASSYGCWFFIVFSFTFIVASCVDIHLLRARARDNGEQARLKNLLVPMLPIAGATIWIFGSVCLLPHFESVEVWGAPSFILGSLLFQASSLISLSDLCASKQPTCTGFGCCANEKEMKNRNFLSQVKRERSASAPSPSLLSAYSNEDFVRVHAKRSSFLLFGGVSALFEPGEADTDADDMDSETGQVE